MILESNNYELDTLLIYLQDGQITASEAVSHASEDVRRQYLSFIAKKNIPEDEDSAAKFLDWLQEEEQELTDEDEIQPPADEDEDDEQYKSWRNDGERLERLAFSKTAPKVCLWRLQNPMSKDKERCSMELGIDGEEVSCWWMTPVFLEECVGHRLILDNLDEDKISDLIFHECTKI